MTRALQHPIRLRTVALPAEHGGWGFLLEPIVLGMLVAPSLTGALIALAAIGVFLMHQPLKLAVKDWRKGKRAPRTPWAERFALLYGTVAGLSFGLALWIAPSAFWLPLLLAGPLAAVQLFYDARNKSRELVPEMSGAMALSLVAPGIALAGGWSLISAMALWLILLARAIPSILYIRARLRLERGKNPAKAPTWMMNLVGLVVVSCLVYAGLSPLLAVLAIGILLLRALCGLLPYRRTVTTQTIGFLELGYGVLTVVLTTLGYWLQL